MKNSERSNLPFTSEKQFQLIQIIEIICLTWIFLEQIFIFLLSFKRNTIKRIDNDPRSIIFPRKSFLYGCLHRNWIRAYSFSNICLSITSFILLLIKIFQPNSIQSSSSSPTHYSLPLKLFEQLNINFSQFHLFLVSINVFEYFLRAYRYSNSYFNHRNFLLTKHTNVALILTGSLALIFAYNFVFYTDQDNNGKWFLPLITLNMILLLLINFLIFILILLCLLLNILVKIHLRNLSSDDEQEENLRSIIERNTCMKCYSKILENNVNLFQENNDSFRNSTSFRADYDDDNLSFHRKISMKFNCQLCFYLLLIFLFKYLLLTSPWHCLQVWTVWEGFYSMIWQKKMPEKYSFSVVQNSSSWTTISHLIFLCARLGDSILLIRFSYLMKKYFPCWCQFNSTYQHEKPIPPEHPPRRYRLRFQYLPIWSRDRPRLFPENQQ